MRKFTFAAALGAATFALSACSAQEAVAEFESEQTDSTEYSSTYGGQVSQKESEPFYGTNPNRTFVQEAELAALDNMTDEELRAHLAKN